MIEESVLSSRLQADGRSWIRLSPEQRRAREEYLFEFGPGDHRRWERCPSCSGENSVLIARKDVYGLPVDNFLCSGCALIYKNPLLTPEATGRYYRRISSRLRGKEVELSSREQLFRTRVEAFGRKRFEFIRKNVPTLAPGSLVVEFGAYDGANLAPFKEAGFSVLGFDIDDGAFGPARAAGVELRTGVPGTVSLPGAPAVMILSHFVEHLGDPLSELSALRKILGEGVLFVEVPGVRTEGAKNLLGYFMAEHNFSFDAASLKFLMAQAGFQAGIVDEAVRGLFRSAGSVSAEKASGGDLLEFLKSSESRYGDLSPRALYHRLRVFAVNEILYRLEG